MTRNTTESRRGYTTTEFWLTIAGLVLGVIQQAVGVFNITDGRVLLFQGILAAAYAASRGLAKAGVPNVEPVPPTPPPPR